MEKILDYITDISAIVGSLAVILALIIANRQFRKYVLQINASTLFEIDKILHETRPYWIRLYAQVNVSHTNWNEEQREIADKVSIELDRIAYLSANKFVDEKILLDKYATVFARTWECLREYIKSYREYCGESKEIKDGGYQRKNYEIMANKAREYCKKRNISIIPNAYPIGVAPTTKTE